MTKRSVFILGTLLLAACASDPNKAANDARDAELKAQRKQEQSAADNRSDQKQDRAEYDRKVTSGSAAGPEATQERVTADAKLGEARTVARAKATERLEKADARSNELRAIVNRAGAKATTQSRDALQTADNQRVAAKMSIDQIATVPDDKLKQAEDYAEHQLDTYEAYVKRAGKEVDDFK